MSKDVEQSPMIPLAETHEDDQVILAELDGGRDFLHRMAEMGLATGAQFQILKEGNPGPFIILLKETRLMIGRGMIDRIRVRRVEAEERQA